MKDKKKKSIRKIVKKGSKILGIIALVIFLTSCIPETPRGDNERYNISEVELDGLLSLIKLANFWTEDVLIFTFLLGLFLVAFISLKAVATVKRAMVASTFILMISTFLIKMLDIVKNIENFDRIVFVSIIIFVFSAIAIFVDREEVSF